MTRKALCFASHSVRAPTRPLSVGEVKTTVTVEAGAATQVETESSEVSGVVTGKEITQIVLNGRNFTQLIIPDAWG